jgi:hypothetical protein
MHQGAKLTTIKWSMFAALIVVFLALPQAGRTTFMSGNDLFDACGSPQRALVCFGYIEGIADAMQSTRNAGGSLAGVRACLPEDATLGQLKDIVINFLRDHPETRHFTALSITAYAFSAAFPCRTR